MAIMGYAASTSESSSFDMQQWIAKLQEGKKSTAQLQQEILEGISENIDNKLEINAEEESEDEETNKTGEIQDPSTVTKEQLQSPIEIKL